MAFRFVRLGIPDMIRVEADALPDPRGYFLETYRQTEFVAGGIRDLFVQDNHAHSTQGVLRGLHYQKRPRSQAKLVAVLRGEIFDVAVDIRQGSASFGRWVGVVLSADEHQMVYVPEGFAHGYCVLSQDADVVYKVSTEYVPELDRGIIWNDPDIAIRWPVSNPILSAKDATLPLLRAADLY